MPMAKDCMRIQRITSSRPVTIQSRIRWLVVACNVPSWLMAVTATFGLSCLFIAHDLAVVRYPRQSRGLGFVSPSKGQEAGVA